MGGVEGAGGSSCCHLSSLLLLMLLFFEGYGVYTCMCVCVFGGGGGGVKHCITTPYLSPDSVWRVCPRLTPV